MTIPPEELQAHIGDRWLLPRAAAQFPNRLVPSPQLPTPAHGESAKVQLVRLLNQDNGNLMGSAHQTEEIVR